MITYEIALLPYLTVIEEYDVKKKEWEAELQSFGKVVFLSPLSGYGTNIHAQIVIEKKMEASLKQYIRANKSINILSIIDTAKE